MRKFLIKYWKSILFIVFLCVLSFSPSSNFKRFPSFFGVDKVVHFLLYIFLAFILVFDNREMIIRQLTKKLIAYAIVFPIILGGVIEIVQENFFPPRSAEWFDWFMDIAGVLIGYLITAKLLNYWLKQKR